MRGKQILLKLTALIMIAALLSTGTLFGTDGALAGGSLEPGNYSVTKLETNTILEEGDTTITIDYDVQSQSISGEKCNLTFIGKGGILELYNTSGTAVSVKSISFKNCRILYPAGAKVINGKICNASGYPSQRVIIGPDTYHTIDVIKGYAYDYDSESDEPIYYAAEGTKVGFEGGSNPEGQYISGYSCTPSSLSLHVSLESKWFVMGTDDVTITAQYSPQVPGTMDIRSGKFTFSSDDDRYKYQALSIAAGSLGYIHYISGKGLDLDLDGTADIEQTSSDTLVALSSCSIPIAIDIKVSIVTKYNPLTVRFGDPKVTFDLNGGSGAMDPESVTSLEWKYKLPECKATPPTGMEFDKWDKGAPGTELTVKENLTVKALWKDKPAAPQEQEPEQEPQQPAEQQEQQSDEQVTLKKLKSVKLKAVSKKKIKVSWKKLSKKLRKEVKKIQIQVSTDPEFKTILKEKFVSSKKTSYTVSGLKKNTKYYIRVRAYTEKDGIKHVSEWVKKSKKTKKK